MMVVARSDAQAGGPSPAGHVQAEGGHTPGPLPVAWLTSVWPAPVTA
jgi:hypothetical protein